MKKKYYKRLLLCIVVAVLLVGLPLYTAVTHKQASPFQFQEQAAAAALPIGGISEAAINTTQAAIPNEQQKQPDEEREKEEEQEAAAGEEPSTNSESEREEAPSDVQQQQAATAQTNDSKPQNDSPPHHTNRSSNGETAAAPSQRPANEQSETVTEQAIEVVENGTEQRQYFRTNITDQATVTEPTYYVTVTHLQQELTVTAFDVHVNGELQENFTGTLMLTEGENTIQFNATYTDAAQQEFTVTERFTLYLNTADVIISTSLTSHETTKKQLSFIAKAEQQGVEQPLTVIYNDRVIPSTAGIVYDITLQQGDNTIHLSAGSGNDAVEQVVTVTYNKVQQKIIVHTTLNDARVTEELYTFTATATYNDETIPLTATANGTVIEPTEEANYTVQLQPGTNIIQLRATADEESVEQTYKILYNSPHAPPVVVEKDVLAPTIKTDLLSGAVVKGSIKTINVWPTTASGERIRGKNVAVRVNGSGVPFTWDDSSKTSYKLVLQQGENVVSIKVWDDDGRTTTEEFTVTSEAVEHNGVIGQATISVEASTLGIPYLIAPTKVDIHEGEKGSYVIDQFLRDNGFTYYNTGTMETNFYLQSIRKPNMLQRVSIPNDLWTLVEAHSSNANKTDYDVNSLSEFDFANGSGWMYSVNGDYPNYGLSDAYFLDGDVVRIRFTLHYGKDIKGYGGMGGNNGDWSKEW